MSKHELGVFLVGSPAIALLQLLGVHHDMCCAELGCLVARIVLGRLLIDARLRIGPAEAAPDTDDDAEVFAANRLVVEDGYLGGVGA